MRRSLMHRPASGLRQGWWCEFSAYSMADGREAGARLRAHAVDTPQRALVWMRLAVRPLLSAFDPEDAERAYRWFDHGQWEAVMRLRAGEPYAFVASSGDTRVEWSARPVLFLPLAPADGGRGCPCPRP
ncbi:hypothetical protein [Streptomyces graminilatus]|uniref:hypothetical protein n=1 Tax=Streptomyces graminilatus TaxID=1464070 RepID=UPI0006E1C419|nr:hypothetical protein [Streptomyces graminilatus]